MTLLLELEHAQADRRGLAYTDLMRYTVDFDTLFPCVQQTSVRRLFPVEREVYALASPAGNPRPAFEEIVACYTTLAPSHLKPRGRFRPLPANWPILVASRFPL